MLYPFSRFRSTARSPANCGPAAHKKRGFNLIESAIVLGVVGLVIGGIWYAAASVQQSLRINDTAAAIIQIAQGTRRLFSARDYPTASGGQVVTSTLAAAGILPPDFEYVSGNYARSKMGVKMMVVLSCAPPRCPTLRVSVNGPFHPSNPGTMTPSECTQLVRRFGGLVKDNDNFDFVQIFSNSLPLVYLYTPDEWAHASCPLDLVQVGFWFKP